MYTASIISSAILYRRCIYHFFAVGGFCPYFRAPNDPKTGVPGPRGGVMSDELTNTQNLKIGVDRSQVVGVEFWVCKESVNRLPARGSKTILEAVRRSVSLSCE